MSLADNTFSNPYIIYISSRDRASGDNSNFQSNPIDLGLNRYDSCCVCQASIPRSFYNIPLGYNTFTLKESISTATVTIPAGSYNRINLQSVLQTELNIASPNGWAYVVSYPDTTSSGDTFKYTFTVSGNTSQPEFIFTTGMFRQLGFEQNSTNVFVSNSLLSSNCINLAYATRAFIKSNISSGNDVLQEILGYGSYPMLSVAYFEQQDYDLNSRIYNPNNLNSWIFTLVDEFDQIIELNGVSWALSIVLYDRNNTHEILKSDLQYKTEQRLIELQNQENSLKKQIENIPPVFTGADIQLPVGDLTPMFPVMPYYSSTSLSRTEVVDESKKKNKT
jgi:hypothetical protein